MRLTFLFVHDILLPVFQILQSGVFLMPLGFSFFFNNILLGAGLAMDAFSVSLANGLNNPKMKLHKMCIVALVFALFQAAMPLLGWACIHTIVSYFCFIEKFIPPIALILLCFIGGNMILEGVRGKENTETTTALGFGVLMLQGIATSIDALSVGFTISKYNIAAAALAAFIIAAVTFLLCLMGIAIGKAAGTKLSGKAGIFGGIILIFIGIEIFITGIF